MIDNTIIIDYLYRRTYSPGVLSFDSIIAESVYNLTLCKDKSSAEHLATVKSASLWNAYKRCYKRDLEHGIVPLFSIVNESDHSVRWIRDNSGIKREYLTTRPLLLNCLDSLKPREYEALSCVICKLLGAQNVLLTPAGNEGGIDFLAQIPFSQTAHFFFGVKGPIRIVGQCKKYSSRDNVGHMNEFVQTLSNVYNNSFRAGKILPHWFKQENGIIIGWHIAHSGHQSGALDVAKNYGILVSDSRQLVDILCKSKAIYKQKDFTQYIKDQIKIVLT